MSQTRQPYTPRAPQRPGIDAALKAASAYMKSLGPIITDQALDDIIDEVHSRIARPDGTYDQFLCRVAALIRSLRQENQRLETAIGIRADYSNRRLKAGCAIVFTEILEKLLDHPHRPSPQVPPSST